jgi:hypothetical protein
MGLTAPGNVITRINGSGSVAGPETSPTHLENEGETYSPSLKPQGTRHEAVLTNLSTTRLGDEALFAGIVGMHSGHPR